MDKNQRNRGFCRRCYFRKKNKKARKMYKMEMSKILELKKLKITITERFILMDDRMLDLARLRILRLEENSFGIEDKGFNLSYRNNSKSMF